MSRRGAIAAAGVIPAGGGAPATLPDIFPTGAAMGWEVLSISAADGTAVSQIDDEFGTNHLLQGTSARQPSYETAVHGALPVVSFGGPDGENGDGMGVTLGANIAPPVWVLWVGKMRATTSATSRAFFASRNGADKALVASGTAPQPVSLTYGVNYFPFAAFDAWHDAFRFWMFKIDGASSAVRYEDTTSTPDDAGVKGIESNFFLCTGDVTFGTQAADADWLSTVILTAAPTSQQITDYRDRYNV